MPERLVVTASVVDAALLDRTSPNLAARVIAAAGVGGGGAHGQAQARAGGSGARRVGLAAGDVADPRIQRIVLEAGAEPPAQGEGDRVAVWLPNMPAWLALMFACARLGAIVQAIANWLG